MIEMMQDVPDNVLAMTAIGQVTGEDYETVIIPMVEEKLKTHDKLRLLYYISPEFSDYTAAAMWDDAKIGFQHFTNWEKIAVVTDEKWIVRAVKAFGFMMPGEVKLYGNKQLDEAKAWVAA